MSNHTQLAFELSILVLLWVGQISLSGH